MRIVYGTGRWSIVDDVDESHSHGLQHRTDLGEIWTRLGFLGDFQSSILLTEYPLWSRSRHFDGFFPNCKYFLPSCTNGRFASCRVVFPISLPPFHPSACLLFGQVDKYKGSMGCWMEVRGIEVGVMALGSIGNGFRGVWCFSVSTASLGSAFSDCYRTMAFSGYLLGMGGCGWN